MSFDDFWNLHYFNKDKSGYLYKNLKFAWDFQQKRINEMDEVLRYTTARALGMPYIENIREKLNEVMGDLE